MSMHGVAVYPDVFKKADLMKVPNVSIVKDPQESTNINFGKNSYSVRKSDTHTMSIEKATSPRERENEEHDDKPEEDHCSEQHYCQEEKVGALNQFGTPRETQGTAAEPLK